MRGTISSVLALVAAGLLPAAGGEVFELADHAGVPDSEGVLKIEVDGIPRHELLKVSVKLDVRAPVGLNRHLIQRTESPYVLEVATREQILLYSSLSSLSAGQSFPDRFGSFCHAPGAGEVDASPSSLTNHYHFDLVFPHDSDSLSLAFELLKKRNPDRTGRIVGMRGDLFAKGRELYIVTALKVETIEPLPAPDRKTAYELLERIGGTEPMKAHAALQEFIRYGDGMLPFVRQRFDQEQPLPEHVERLERSLKGLASDEFRVRARAEADLISCSYLILPNINQALAGELEIGVRVALKRAKARLEKRAVSFNRALANRLRPALELSATDEANETLDTLPPIDKITNYVPPPKPQGIHGAEAAPIFRVLPDGELDGNKLIPK